MSPLWCNGGPISGPDFFWFLIREKRDFLEQALMEYLNYQAKEDENERDVPWYQRCWINTKRKFEVTMRKNRLLRVHMHWGGRATFKNSHAGGGCPLTGFTLTGNPLAHSAFQKSDRHITFYMYQGKRYEPGDTSLCSECVNQLHCFTQGQPSGYFESVKNVKKRKSVTD